MSMKREAVFLVRDEPEIALATQARVSKYRRHDLKGYKIFAAGVLPAKHTRVH